MNHQIIEILKGAGATDAEIKAVTAALGHVADIKAAADREHLSQIRTPLQACAANSKNVMLWNQTKSMIRHCSAMKYDPASDKPIDLTMLNEAIRGASIENRMAIRSNLKILGCIPA